MLYTLRILIFAENNLGHRFHGFLGSFLTNYRKFVSVQFVLFSNPRRKSHTKIHLVKMTPPKMTHVLVLKQARSVVPKIYKELDETFKYVKEFTKQGVG